MKTKLLLSALFGMAAWSLSSVAAADHWDDGPCPQPHAGPAPCIELIDGDDEWHFNGDGSHADEWHGLPDDLGGGDIEFEGDDVALECDSPAIGVSCTLNLTGQVKKCQDSSGAWRIGVRVTGADPMPGDLLCATLDVGGFPWYSKDPNASGDHCPFEDDCDTFIPYDPNAGSYVGNFGGVDVDVPFFGTPVDNEHLHNVVFTPNNGSPTPSTANFDFSDKTFYSCNEEAGCTIDGILYLNNADELNIY